MGGRATAGMVFLALMLLSLTPVTLAQASGAGWERSCTIHIVAVSSAGGGVLGNLTVTVRYPGHGRVYVSTSPASMVDTQGSARIAAFAASLIAGVDMGEYDFYYAIDSPSIIIGGPSAGSAMALATLAVLEGRECPRDVAITGMIQPDASIGPVGGLKEKLEAAAQGGARLFIVPAGQEVYTYYETRYKRIGPIVTVERVPVTVNLTEYGEELGVKVETAATLVDAYNLAIGGLDLPTGPVQPPAWILDRLASYTESLNKTVHELASEVEGHSTYTVSLASNATSLAEEAVQLLAGGEYYPAAILAVRAYSLALQAYWIDKAIADNLNVTGLVREANETLIQAYSLADNASSEAGRANVDLVVKAYSKLGLASYYYKKALDNLVENNGSYSLPYSIIYGVDPEGAVYASIAVALANWSAFWSKAAISTLPGEPVEDARLEETARLLVAQAKTTTAYVVTLLQEAGGDPRKADAAVYLSDLAMTSQDPLAQIGYSIESIAESTRAIHESFTLDHEATARGLTRIAQSLAYQTGSPVAALLLQYINSTNDTMEQMLAASRAVLYAWTYKELTGNTVNTTTTTTTSPPAATTTTSHETTTESQGATPGNTTGEAQTTGATGQASTGLALALVGLLGLLLGVAVGLQARGGAPS